MVTKKRSLPRPKAPAVKGIQLYLREWRKFMGVSAPDVADALGIERESYLRMERETWRVTFSEAILIATTIGIHVSQLRFPPPEPGKKPEESLDEMVEDKSPEFRRLARAAIRGMLDQQ